MGGLSLIHISSKRAGDCLMKVLQLMDAGNLCVSGSSIDRTFLSLFPEFEDLDVYKRQGIGSEQSGSRPVLILQNNVGNCFSPTIIIAAITLSLIHILLRKKKAQKHL